MRRSFFCAWSPALTLVFPLILSKTIRVIRLLRQACLVWLMALALAAQEDAKEVEEIKGFEFKAPLIRESIFKEGLGLLDRRYIFPHVIGERW